MVELGIIGAKNSGKTTVIEGLIGYLVGRGYKVATIKHTSHAHRFDSPGKDSFRHRQAGAGLTIAMSTDEMAIFTQPDLLDKRRLQKLMEAQIDLWLIEGERNAAFRKVLVTRNLGELSEPLPENIVATIGPVRLNGVPVHFEPNDFDGLGSFVGELMLKKKTEMPK